jgi:glycosyltransferase involved in cell wall biosynthesis
MIEYTEKLVKIIEINLMKIKSCHKILLIITILSGEIFYFLSDVPSYHSVLSIAGAFLALITFTILLFVAFSNTRIGICIVLITLPLHFSPFGHWTASLPLKNMATYFAAAVLLGEFMRNGIKWMYTDDRKSAFTFFAFAGIIFTGILSIFTAPYVKSWESLVTDISNPGTYAYSISKMVLLSICVSFALLIVRKSRTERFLKIIIDAALYGWALSLFFALIGLYIIFTGYNNGENSYVIAYRATSTFFSVTSAGGYTAILLPLAIYKLRSLTNDKLFRQALAVLTLCFISIAMVVSTTSRSAIIIVLITLIFFILHHYKERLFRGCILLMLIFTIGAVSLWSYPPKIYIEGNHLNGEVVKRYGDGNGEVVKRYGDGSYLLQRLNDNNQTRINLNLNALDLWYMYPIFGVGHGMMSNYSVNGEVVSDSHNIYTTALAEQGLLGFISIFSLTTFFGYSIFNLSKKTLHKNYFYAMSLLIALGVFIHFQLHLNFNSLWCWVALSIASLGFLEKPDRESVKLRVIHLMRTYGAHGGERQLSQYFGLDPHSKIDEKFLFVYRDPECLLLFKENSININYDDLLSKTIKTRTAWGEFAVLLPILPWLQLRFLIQFFRSYPTVITVHGFQAALIAWPLAIFFRQVRWIYVHRITKSTSGSAFLFKILYIPFHVVAGNSQAVAKSLVPLVKNGLVETLDNGLNWRLFDERSISLRAPLPESSELVLVSVGRLLPHKGQSLIIDAFERLFDLYPSAVLWIVGDGQELERLKILALNSRAASKIYFLGQREDVPALLCKSDIFINASDREGMSNAVLEAMAAGLPSVVIDAPGVSECHIEGVTGFIVKRDIFVFVEMISRLLGNEELRSRMGSAARLRLVENYSMEANRNRYLRLFERLTDRKLCVD